MEGIYRCRICGEVYFGKHPSHCPFCGAHLEWLVPLEEWEDENTGVNLTVAERKNVKTTQELEYTNTRFYRAASKCSKNTQIQGYFKYLAKIENEHYNVACKLLGEEKDASILEPSEEKGNDLANLEESKKAEEYVTKLYAEFIPQSESKRIKDFFGALTAVEADHIELDIEEIDKISK